MPYIEIVQKYAQKNRFEYNHEEIFNKVRNCVKTRNLAFKFFGPKC